MWVFTSLTAWPNLERWISCSSSDWLLSTTTLRIGR